jgi:crotonobetainyl-CoA:carnitine CoA-transferase CaiB-like acyl-CoA transferase
MGALTGVRIVELAQSVAGEYCGKLLAELGAEVVKVEPPGRGSPTRAMAPMVAKEGKAPVSALFAYLNTNKRSVTIDLEADTGHAELAGLLRTSAAVLGSHHIGWLQDMGLTLERLQAEFPGLVFTNITGFGLDAPKDLHAAPSLILMQASGWGYHTASYDDLTKPPLKGAGRFHADYEGGLDGAIATLAALTNRERSGMGDFIDLSIRSTLVSRADHAIGRMIAGEMDIGDERTAYNRSGPIGAYRCADGYIHFYATPVHWPGVIELMGNPAWTAGFAPDWLFNLTDDAVRTFREHFTPWVADKLANPLCERAQALGLPIVRVNDAEQLFKSKQLAARGFFQELDHPDLGRAAYPTASYRLSATPVRLDRHAPALGEDNGLLAAPPANAHPPAKVQSAPTPRGGPLAGIRVLEITKVWAGPYAGKLLAFLGAEVIKVESRNTIDDMRKYQTDDIDRSPIFQSLNPEVLSVQVNMKSEKGLHHLKEMIARSDVVLDNLRPGALARLGLDYEGMRAIKPDIIHVSLKMNGAHGPLAHQTGYAPSFLALSGIHSLVGYEGEPPLGMNQFYGDTTAGAAVACAALAALVHRLRTGKGQFADVSATEALSCMIGDSLMEYSLTGKAPRHDGNRHADMAPHGVFPCRAGEWIAIAAADDNAWSTLCTALRAPKLADDPRFASLAARQRNLEVLDSELTRLTRRFRAAPLAALLRHMGVPAHKSCNSLDLVSDAQLWQRETYTHVTDSDGKLRPIIGSPWRFSRNQTKLSRGAPSLGEHNTYVYCDLLGIGKEQLETLLRNGTIE